MTNNSQSSTYSTILLGGGCFWCLEAVYQRVIGVHSVESGYAGGTTPQPTYQNIGNHAEVVKISYNPNIISLAILLDIFFSIHDPTTVNRQGNDVGEQYRSIIIYHPSDEKEIRAAIQRANKDWAGRIVTELQVGDSFIAAETYHQNYYNQNQSNPYCQVVIHPKLSKFSETYHTYLLP